MPRHESNEDIGVHLLNACRSWDRYINLLSEHKCIYSTCSSHSSRCYLKKVLVTSSTKKLPMGIIMYRKRFGAVVLACKSTSWIARFTPLIGALLIDVNGEVVLLETYQSIMQRLETLPRPLCLRFIIQESVIEVVCWERDLGVVWGPCSDIAQAGNVTRGGRAWNAGAREGDVVVSLQKQILSARTMTPEGLRGTITTTAGGVRVMSVARQSSAGSVHLNALSYRAVRDIGSSQRPGAIFYFVGPRYVLQREEAGLTPTPVPSRPDRNASTDSFSSSMMDTYTNRTGPRVRFSAVLSERSAGVPAPAAGDTDALLSRWNLTDALYLCMAALPGAGIARGNISESCCRSNHVIFFLPQLLEILLCLRCTTQGKLEGKVAPLKGELDLLTGGGERAVKYSQLLLPVTCRDVASCRQSAFNSSSTNSSCESKSISLPGASKISDFLNACLDTDLTVCALFWALQSRLTVNPESVLTAERNDSWGVPFPSNAFWIRQTSASSVSSYGSGSRMDDGVGGLSPAGSVTDLSSEALSSGNSRRKLAGSSPAKSNESSALLELLMHRLGCTLAQPLSEMQQKFNSVQQENNGVNDIAGLRVYGSYRQFEALGSGGDSVWGCGWRGTGCNRSTVLDTLHRQTRLMVVVRKAATVVRMPLSNPSADTREHTEEDTEEADFYVRSSVRRNMALRTSLRSALFVDTTHHSRSLFPLPNPLSVYTEYSSFHSIDISKCRVLSSANYPLLLAFREGPLPSPSRFLLYKGSDDLHQDALVVQMFRYMDRLLVAHGVDLRMELYSVLPTGPQEGLVEWIADATPLAKVIKKYSRDERGTDDERHREKREDSERNRMGAPQEGNGRLTSLCSDVCDSVIEKHARAFTENTWRRDDSTNVGTSQTWNSNDAVAPTEITRFSCIRNFLAAKSSDVDSAMSKFVSTCAGNSVMTFVLGVGDRHLDNILLLPSGAVMHCDFGYCFGRDPGHMIYSSKLRFTKEMLEAMGGDNSVYFSNFQTSLASAYIVLRRNASLLFNMVRSMADAGISDLSVNQSVAETLSGLEARLRLDLDEQEAGGFIKSLARENARSFMPVIMDKMHEIASYFR